MLNLQLAIKYSRAMFLLAPIIIVYTALELKLLTNIPIRITHDLLEGLTRINMLTEVTKDEKGTESMYQPAESTANLSVGMMIDRMEAEGNWKLMPVLKSIDAPQLMEAMRHRKDYLRLQRDILFKDIALPTTTAGADKS